MIHSRTALGLLLGVLTLQEGALQLSPPPQSPNRNAGCPTPGGPALPATPARPIECKLKSGEEHAFRVSLRAGDFLQAQVSQQRIDAVVTVVDPVGKVLLRMDSPTAGEGEEPVLALADKSGDYGLRVAGSAKGWSGSYQLSIQKPRPASPADRVRVEALRKMAEGDLTAALQAWESVGDTWGQVLALYRQALLLNGRRAYSEVLSVCSQGALLARDRGDLPAEGRFVNLAGLAHRSLGEWKKARDLFERALDLFEQGGDAQGQALSLNNLGLISEDRGDLQGALDRYRASLELWDQVDDPEEHPNTLLNLGEVYLALGQPLDALGLFNEALHLTRRVDRRDIQYAVIDGAGLAFHDLGLWKKALWNHRLALGLADTPGQRARTLYRIGLVYREEKNLRQAAKMFEEALRLARSQGDRMHEAYALAELAHVDHLQGRTAEALPRYDQARALFEELDVSLYVASSLFGRARVERDLGRPEDAVASVKRSVAIVEALRADVMEPRHRVSFFASRHRFYELYVELLMELHRPEQSFEANESTRARTLLDDVAGSGRPAKEAMSLEEIQRELLDRGSRLLVYSLGTRRSHLWAVSRDAIETFELPARDVVEEEALRVWQGLSEKGGRPDVVPLSRMLLPAGLDLPPNARLLVSADGPLHLIPFAALRGPDGRLLVLDHTIVYAPSASVLVGMRRKLKSRLPAPKGIATFADPVFEQDDLRLGGDAAPAPDGEIRESRSSATRLSRLVSSRREARAILDLFPDKDRSQAFDFDANRSAATDPSLGRHRFVHFATHHKSGTDPGRTGLVLSRFDEQGHPIDGLLRTTEVYNLHLPVELVVLSACGTGLAEEVRGEGPMGLPRAFLHAGAERVVVSLWDVEDGATAELMTRFYRGMLKGGLSPAEALRAAQVSMASEPKWRSPRHWAPFILLGEPD